MPFLVLAIEACAFGPGSGWLNRAWQIEDGLPDAIVDAVVQGPDGYLWVGTSAGLVRFDGVRFEKVPLQELPGIPNAGVRALRVDRQGAIWVGMDRGPMVCLEAGGVRVFTEAQGLPTMIPWAIADDEAAGVWVSYAAPGSLVRIQNGEVARFGSREGLSGRGPWRLGNLAYEHVRDYPAAQIVLDRQVAHQNATVCRTTGHSPNVAWDKALVDQRSAIRPCPPATLLDLHLALHLRRRVNADLRIGFLGRSWPIAATKRATITLIHHPLRQFWAVTQPPQSPKNIWPEILGNYSL